MGSIAATERVGASDADERVRRAALGDVAAFGALIATRLDRCYRLAYSILATSPLTRLPMSVRSPRGWPGTGQNPAGVYSARGETACSSSHCIYGFMHNGHGSGDVEVRIKILPRLPVIEEGATAATVAGHPAMYRQTGGLEAWIVDVDGTAIEIALQARPGTSPTDLAEAHAIIESMRTEPQDDELGFMLTFRLTTDDWDSG